MSSGWESGLRLARLLGETLDLARALRIGAYEPTSAGAYDMIRATAELAGAAAHYCHDWPEGCEPGDAAAR